MNELQHAYQLMNPLAREADLTGPHHVGVEVDLEMQALHWASWRTIGRVSKIVGALAFIYAAAREGPNPTARAIAIGGSLMWIMSEAVSNQVCSRAVTSAPPALQAVMGKMGSWQPLGMTKAGEVVDKPKPGSFTAQRHESVR